MDSKEFKELREKMGLSQTELGVAMGMIFQAISKIETGQRNPTKIQAAFIRLIAKTKEKKA